MTMEAIFKVKNKKGEANEDIKMFQSLVFGRGKNSNISITDEKISGVHCQISFKDDRMEIIDLDSKNGTYLNGIRIEHSEIFVGDEIRIGQTFITFNAAKMSPEAIELLSFPGRFKDRINYELRIDFTGARVQNQQYQKEHPHEVLSAFQAKEIALRKKANSKIHLSKEEIRNNNKVLGWLSTLIDMTFLVAMVVLPLIYFHSIDSAGPVRFLTWDFPEESFHKHKVLIICCIEMIGLSTYFFSKTKMKYSVGEKIAGIQDLHINQ
jgi:hypothetical protein